MNRRLVLLGVCFLFLGPHVLSARSANTSVSPGRVRQVGQRYRRCSCCGRTCASSSSCCPSYGPRVPAYGPCPPSYGPRAPAYGPCPPAYGSPAPGYQTSPPAARPRPPVDPTAPEVERPEPAEPRREEPRVPDAEPRPTEPRPAQPRPTEPRPTAPRPSERQPTAPPTAPPPGAVAAAPTPVAPNMLGDYFRGGGGTLDIHDWDEGYHPDEVFFPSPGAVVGTTKIAENTSPLPQDRFFLNYSYFDNTLLYPGGVNVSRLTPGFEKTFWRGNASFELRVPMAVTLDSVIVLDDGPDLSHGELGNLALTPKLLLWRDFRGAVSAGITIAVPTADDVHGVLADGTHLARIENEAVHLMPFVGWLWTPNPRFFAHGFLQYDVPANGNPVAIDREFGGPGLEHVGYLNDAVFQYLDVGIGYWTYRTGAPVRYSRLRSIALTAELHWNKSLQRGDYVEDTTSPEFSVGNTARNVDVWDATVGMHVRLRDTTISLAYITPIGGGADQPFDGELRLTLNRWFGRSSQAYGYGAYPGVFP